MKRILFVDDESRILDALRRMLYQDRKRWEMEFVVGGDAALQACEKVPYDVVVCDMQMPGMDGATLLEKVRDRLPGAARIVLSGQSDTESTNRAISVAHLFLAKPCGASELQGTIDRVCTLQELLTSQELRRIIGTIESLPSLPSTYASLQRAVSDPNTSSETVAHIIERDVAMSAKVLQLVNSAFFGLSKTVSSVPYAVNFLGLDTLKHLVLVAETFAAFAPTRRFSKAYWQSLQDHAARVAEIAVQLPIDRKARDMAVIAALLHDIGALILATRASEQFEATRLLAQSRKCRSFEAEEEMLGVSHAEVGAYLLGLWGLPHVVVEAIAHHHRPDRISHMNFDTTVAIYIADLIDHKLQHGQIELSEAETTCLDVLGFKQHFPQFVEQARGSRNGSELRTDVGAE